MNGNVLQKLKILTESAKYDVSCSSSGTVRRGKAGMVGNAVGGIGICHSFADDGRCISLLKEQRHTARHAFGERTGGADDGVLPA